MEVLVSAIRQEKETEVIEIEEMIKQSQFADSIICAEHPKKPFKKF